VTSTFDPAAEGWFIRDDEPGFIALVGPLWQRGEGKAVAFGFLAQEKHLNRRNVVHGGALMTFADQALGLTAREVTGGLPQATIQLDTHFLAPAAAGEIVRHTRSILFMQGTVSVGERAIASAQGIWKVLARS